MFCLKLRESMVCGTEKNPVPADHAFFAVALYIMNIMYSFADAGEGICRRRRYDGQGTETSEPD